MWLLGPFIIITWGLEIGFGIWGKIRIEAASSRSVCKSMTKERPCQHSYIHTFILALFLVEGEVSIAVVGNKNNPQIK